MDEDRVVVCSQGGHHAFLERLLVVSNNMPSCLFVRQNVCCIVIL